MKANTYFAIAIFSVVSLCRIMTIPAQSPPCRAGTLDLHTYGKYEVRDKVPLVHHHLNNWGSSAAFEYDMDEWYGGGMFEMHPGISHNFLYGPFKGRFAYEFGDTTFRCPAAHWGPSNNPHLIVINGFSYEMGLNLHRLDSTNANDTFLIRTGLNTTFGIPSSLRNSTDSFSFYYTKQNPNASDSLMHWNVRQDGSNKWRIFSAPYRVLNGDPLRFSKMYQPTTITLKRVGLDSLLHSVDRTLNCHWEYNLNHPTDSGLIYLDDTMYSSDIHSGDSGFLFTVDEGPGYPVPPVPIDDSNYRYHTFTMELLPHEMRILLDSNVVRRFPDRLTPMDHKDYDYITKLPRAPADAYIGEFDIDPLGGHGDPFGSDTTSITYRERKFFEQHDTSSTHGCWDVNIGGRTYHAAHHRVDYIDILDLPQGMKTAEYPN